MPTLRIDGQEITVEDGATLLDAAGALGIHVPTLCFVKEYLPGTSCMVCVVEVEGERRMLPACATPAREGMVVRTETEAVQAARKMAIELILSDHVGDCTAPCESVCPAGFAVPEFLRMSMQGRYAQAGALAATSLILPQTLGSICPAPCKKTCRRGHLDDAQAPVDIPALHASSLLYQSREERVWQQAIAGNGEPKSKQTAQTVRVIGGGPSGLAVAVVLGRLGYSVILSEKDGMLATTLRARGGDDCVERDLALWLPSEWIDVRCHDAVDLNDPESWFVAGDATMDLVVLACGRPGRMWREKELPESVAARVILCGESRSGCGQMAVRAVADGLCAARLSGQILSGQLNGKYAQADFCDAILSRKFSVHLGALLPEEKTLLLHLAQKAQVKIKPEKDSGSTEAIPEDASSIMTEAQRCLHCDCRAADHCKLRELAQELGTRPRAYLPHPVPQSDHGIGEVQAGHAPDKDHPAPHRRLLRIDTSHKDILYEPGKCILCGLCIQVAQNAGEPLGHAFLGRGFAVQVGAPLHEPLEQALRVDPHACVRICPTGALSFRDDE